MAAVKQGVKTIFSGIQPTGIPHLGNYLGALVNWVSLQGQGENVFYSVVDLHAITVPQDPAQLNADIRDAAATLIACGIDPKQSHIFQQSAVPEHTELSWYLSCATPMGWLNRMTQYKEKKGKHADKALLGLYAYPVLMSADILLYNTTHVPVGDDQRQHLELARDIATTFNSRYGGDVFKVPQGIFVEGSSARGMSLNNGQKKMSKSDLSKLSRINMNDSADEIRKKIRKAKTDGEAGFHSATTADGSRLRPEVHNLLGIRAALEGVPIDDVAGSLDSRGAGTKVMKDELTELLIDRIDPIAAEIERLRRDEAYLSAILTEGTATARAVAHDTITAVRGKMGLATI